MRKKFNDISATEYNNCIQCINGDAENIPFNNNTFDLIICAQSFHWFATNSALNEIHRVLRKNNGINGSLGLIWNTRMDDSNELNKSLEALIDTYYEKDPSAP